MQKIIILILILSIHSTHSMSDIKKFSNLSQSQLKSYIQKQVDTKIEQFFAKTIFQFTSFDSVKNYIKNGPIIHEKRQDGRSSTLYHCRYPHCTRTSLDNISNAASCFLHHYSNTFFSCPACSKTYAITTSFYDHIKACKMIHDSHESEEISCSSNEESHNTHTEYEVWMDFDLEILDNSSEIVLDSLYCNEELDAVGVDPKVIFNISQQQYPVFTGSHVSPQQPYIVRPHTHN